MNNNLKSLNLLNLKNIKKNESSKTEITLSNSKDDPLEIVNNTSEVLTIKKPSNNKSEIVEIKQTSSPSIFYEFKKSLGLENYSDGSFILYFFLVVFTIQRVNELFGFIKNIIVLPKQVAETYNFITKEDLVLINKLDDLMNRLLGITGADRIAIAKIHNGTFDNTGSHQMKFSIIYEVISNRAKPTKENVQNIPINYIRDEILLGSSKEFQRIERSNLDSKCDMYLDKIGIVAKDYKLMSINKIIYGILDIHYITIPESDFNEDVNLKKRFNNTINELEECLQSILLKRTWIQRTFNSIFKQNSK